MTKLCFLYGIYGYYGYYGKFLGLLMIESWEDPNHRAIPSDVYSWCTAFQDVDKDVKRVHANAPKIVYFFPHPSLFVNGELNERRERYFCTWLVLQSAWITCLSILDPSPVVPL